MCAQIGMLVIYHEGYLEFVGRNYHHIHVVFLGRKTDGVFDLKIYALTILLLFARLFQQIEKHERTAICHWSFRPVDFDAEVIQIQAFDR